MAGSRAASAGQACGGRKDQGWAAGRQEHPRELQESGASGLLRLRPLSQWMPLGRSKCRVETGGPGEMDRTLEEGIRQPQAGELVFPGPSRLSRQCHLLIVAGRGGGDSQNHGQET